MSRRIAASRRARAKYPISLVSTLEAEYGLHCRRREYLLHMTFSSIRGGKWSATVQMPGGPMTVIGNSKGEARVALDRLLAIRRALEVTRRASRHSAIGVARPATEAEGRRPTIQD
jgi:hypothetical protein